MSQFLKPENAKIHFDKLKEAVAKVPRTDSLGELHLLVDELDPLVGKGEPELEGVLESYITASQAILMNNTAPTTVAGKRRQTSTSKTLGAITAHANALLSFCEEDGDEVIDRILKLVAVISEELS